MRDRKRPPFEDTIERSTSSGETTRILRVGDYVTALEYEDGRLVDYQIEDWAGAAEVPGQSPGRLSCQVAATYEGDPRNPRDVQEDAIRFWMRAHAYYLNCSPQASSILDERVFTPFQALVAFVAGAFMAGIYCYKYFV